MFAFEKLSACDFCAACADQPNSLEPDAAYRQYGFGEFGAMWRASQLQTDGRNCFDAPIFSIHATDRSSHKVCRKLKQSAVSSRLALP